MTVTIESSNCTPQTVVIGRRGTYDTMHIVFDLSYLIENYGDGTAVLLIKRPEDINAYQAVATQDGSTLTWDVSEIDTSVVGTGECELFWYVGEGLAKSVIYPLVVLRDIGETTEEPPDPYETWIDYLTSLGAETLRNAQEADQSAREAETAQEAAETAQEASEEAQRKAEESEENSEVNALKSEGYAVGTQNEIAVQPGSLYFENNSKFYSEVAQQGAAEGGWVHFYIDENGDLHYVKTENVDLVFYLLNGDLYVRM